MQKARLDGLLILLLAYAAASLFHHIHNAEYLTEYPGLPDWLSRTGVYAAWLGVTLVGVAGYSLWRRGFRFAGLFVIAVYGALGFDGLAHFAIAPSSAYSPTMHLTIWLEAATAALLLIAVARRLFSRSRSAQ